MALQPVAPLPDLPLELEREILTFCDPATLAKACQVSFAFLELASPLLYTHISLVGPDGLEKLFTLTVSN